MARFGDHMTRRTTYRLAGGLLLATFVVLLVRAYPTGWEDPVFDSPRSNVTFELARHWADGDGLRYHSTLADQLPADLVVAATPRDAAMVDGDILPKDFALSVIVFSGAQLLPAGVTPFLVPLFSALGIASAGWLVFILTGRRSWAWLAALVQASLPSYLSASAKPLLSDVPAVALLLAGLALVARSATREPSPRASFEAGLGMTLLFASAGMRYTLLGFVLVFVIVFVVTTPILRVQTLVLSATAGVVLAAVVLSFNAVVYGDPLTSGYSIASGFAADTVNPQGGGILMFDPQAAMGNLVNYVLRPETLLVLVIGAAAILPPARAYWRRLLPDELDGFYIATWAGFFLYTGFVLVGQLGGRSWGVEEFRVNASFARYLMPSVAVGIVLGATWVSGVTARMWRELGGAVLALSVVWSLPFSVYGSIGLVDKYQTIERLEADREALLAAIPEGAAVITQSLDKILWPERDTITATFLVRNEDPTPQDLGNLWGNVPDPVRLVEVLQSLCATLDRDVYLVDDGRWLREQFDGRGTAMTRDLLAGTGVRLVRIAGVQPILHLVDCGLPA